MTKPDSFLERVEFDVDSGEVRDGDARYMFIRTDALMGVFRELSDAARAEAMEAFAASIFEHGGRSARMYQEMGIGMGDSEAGRLLDTIAGTAPQLGWGRWSFDRSEKDRLVLSVTNSPFVFGYGESAEPVCAGIRGMLKAVSAMVLGVACEVDEVHCAATGGESVCTFSARGDMA